MGGLEIDCDSAVLGPKNKAIKGLYAAGEVAGGVHGNNRLGGNSLLDCVVFGRVSAVEAAKYMLGTTDLPQVSLKSLKQLPKLKAEKKPEETKPAADAPKPSVSSFDPMQSVAYPAKPWKP